MIGTNRIIMDALNLLDAEIFFINCKFQRGGRPLLTCLINNRFRSNPGEIKPYHIYNKIGCWSNKYTEKE